MVQKTAWRRYNQTITPFDKTLKSDKAPKDHLLMLSVGLILLAAGWLIVWSGHFQSNFHADDVPAIVENQFVHHLSSVPRFFTTPRISSMEKDSAAYRPLLSAWFAVDYHLGGANPFAFQMENFIWFTAELLALFLLLRLIPGVNNAGAVFAVMVFGLHPVNAATVNYALRRGVIMGAFGVTAGMLIWLIWPRRLPQAIPLRLKRIPQDAFDEYLRKNFKRLDTLYRKVIHAPAGLYLWPVIPALLCEPSAVVFAPILVAWILLFEEDRRLGRAIPAAVVCGGYWIFQAVLTRTLGEFSDTPAANYRFTQPWVALRDLYRFFVPLHLSAESDFRAFARFWDPLAIAGYLGVACLAALAVFLGRRRQWKAVSFGIFWFLIALVPDAITAHRAVEADWRMFLPFAGLAIGVAGLASNAVRLLTRQGQPAEDGAASHLPFSIAGGCVALALLALLGWGTFERNAAWETESTLWRAAIASSPRSGRALMRYGLTELTSPDPLPGLNHLREAAQVSPQDPVVGTSLARAYERLGTPAEAESQYRKTIAEAPSYSPVYSSYAQWLLAQSRISEASGMAEKALALDPYDLAGRRTRMDILADTHQWAKLKDFANGTLRLFPDDADGQRSLLVAQTGLDQIGKAETQAKEQPTVDHYLSLSVLYYQSGKYEESIEAARQALKINPNQAEAYANIASAYHAMGKLDETIAALREAIRLNPNLPSAQSNLEIELAAKEKEGR